MFIKLLLGALLFISSTICSARNPYDFYMFQVLPDNSDVHDAYIPLIAPADGLFYFNGTTKAPGFVSIGSGLGLSSGVLSLGTHTHSFSDITGLQSSLDAKYSASNPSNFISVSGARSAISLTTTGTSGAATYNSTTGVLNVPNYSTSGTTKTFNNNVSRTLNSNYTISSTRDARLSYSINAAWTLNALLGGSGTAFLEYSNNAGSSWILVNQVGKSLNLLTFTGSDDMNLAGSVPANALVRIRTTTSNMTISYITGQEVLD